MRVKDITKKRHQCSPGVGKDGAGWVWQRTISDTDSWRLLECDALPWWRMPPWAGLRWNREHELGKAEGKKRMRRAQGRLEVSKRREHHFLKNLNAILWFIDTPMQLILWFRYRTFLPPRRVPPCPLIVNHIPQPWSKKDSIFLKCKLILPVLLLNLKGIMYYVLFGVQLSIISVRKRCAWKGEAEFLVSNSWGSSKLAVVLLLWEPKEVELYSRTLFFQHWSIRRGRI